MTRKYLKYDDPIPSNSVDWATAMVGEADRELTCVTLTYHNSGPIYETSAQSMELSGTLQFRKGNGTNVSDWALKNTHTKDVSVM